MYAHAQLTLTRHIQIRVNLFEKKYANAFVALAGTPESPGRALGLALWFFNFSTWTGKRHHCAQASRRTCLFVRT